jgi:hypothetical protein
MDFSGLVIKEVVGKGSKSEHAAVMLETAKERFLLRRQGGNPFRDPELDRLVGKRIKGSGVVTGNTLIMSDWRESDEADN